jgi:hypothetical protein
MFDKPGCIVRLGGPECIIRFGGAGCVVTFDGAGCFVTFRVGSDGGFFVAVVVVSVDKP